jgi:hypothetical protein
VSLEEAAETAAIEATKATTATSATSSGIVDYVGSQKQKLLVKISYTTIMS